MTWLEQDFKWVPEGSMQGGNVLRGTGVSCEKYLLRGTRSDGKQFVVTGTINFTHAGEPGRAQAEEQIRSNFDEYLDPIRFPDGH